MPGLSNYKPGLKPGPNEDGIYEYDPTVTGEWETRPSLAEMAEAQDANKKALGFANPARSFADQVFHGLAANVPRNRLDDVLTIQTNEDDDIDMSFRQMLDLIKKLSPLDESGPLGERQLR